MPLGKETAKLRADRAMAMFRRDHMGPAAKGAVESPPPVSPPSDERMRPAQHLQRAKHLLAQGQAALAHAELEQAHALRPDSAEVALYMCWTALMIGASSDAAKVRLKSAANTAVKADPGCAFAYFVMGELALLEKNENQALRFVQHALKLDPNLVDAQRRLRLLTRK